MNVLSFDNPPPFWDELVSKAGSEAGISQSTHRANVLSKTRNSKPIYLQVFEKDKLLASLLVFHHKLDLKRDRVRKLLRTILLGRFKGHLNWRDGPVFHEPLFPLISNSIDLLVTWMQEYSEIKGLYQISGSLAHGSQHNKSEVLKKCFSRNGFNIQTWATLQVDLTVDEATLLRRIKKSARKALRKAQRRDVSINKIETLSELKSQYYHSFKEFRKVAGQTTNPFERLSTVWENDTENYYHYFVAKNANNQILATLGMYCFNRVATEVESSLSPLAMRDQIPAQDLLHWEMMLEAKRLGCNRFDLAGVNPNPEGAKEKGIRQFKEKWSGEYKEFLRFHKRI